MGTAVRRYLPFILSLSLFAGFLPLAAAPAALAAGPGVVISEFRVRGPNGGNDEFVEIYNSSAATIAIGGWTIRGSNNSAGVSVRATIPAGVTIGSGCYYLLTNSSASGGPYSGAVPGDQTYATGVTDDGGIALAMADATIVDAVGMSAGSAYKEGTTLASLGTSNLNRGYERKPGASAGNAQDTDDNSADFQLLAPSAPQNSASACIVPGTPTDPSGVGAADPSTVAPGEQSLLTVSVTGGTLPASTGLAVSADLTAIGGGASQAFFDDGSNGDVSAGDNVFSFLATVHGSTADGAKLLPFEASDAQARSGTGDISLNVLTPVTGSDVVISEFRVRGPAGGNDEFVELYNRSAAPVDISGWLLRGSNASGTAGTRAIIPAGTTLDPGCYYLLTNSAASGYSGSVTGDQTYATGITDDGGLALALPDVTLLDQVGLSAGSAYKEGTPLASLGGSNLDRGYERKPGGAAGGDQDTDDNSADFQLITPSDPQNSETACVGAPTGPAGDGTATPFAAVAGGSTLLTVEVTPGTNPPSSGLAVSADLSEIGGSAAQALFDDGTNGDTTGGDNVFSYLATVAVGTTAGPKSVPFTVTDAQDRSSSDTIALTVVQPCGGDFTPTYTLQGSGSSTTFSGFQETQGVLIGNYQGNNTTLRGFYIQDAAGDGDDLTSDGLFVFNGGPTQTFALGDLVRVSGTISEFQGQTQISMVAAQLCSSGHDITPVDVTFPVPPPSGGVDYLERVEGMLVALPQTLYVTEHFQLGRFGQVTMSSGGRLQQPTAVVEPGAPAQALQAANNLNRIIVDDDSQAQNPDPILFGRGGNPLSASNTLRGGDTASGITGVMTWTWAGNAASGNNWRIRPNTAMHGGIPDFQPANPRPPTPVDVGGTVQVGALNLLNYFNTFANCTTGVSDPTPSTSDCRGAENSTEFDRQWAKTVAAIVGMDVDVLGIMEIENDGYGPSSAIAHLVDRLNDATAPGTYAFIDADAGTGEVDALGSDAIKVGLIYRPGDVTPVGTTAVLNSIAFVNSGTPEPRNRPSLAQAFEVNGNGGVFIVDVNHLKSKGSGCGPGNTPDDAGDGQGNCNVARTVAAELLADWLATDPTGTGTADVLIVGDLNAYAKEDPIAALEDAGFANLVNMFSGDDAFSYVFDGQWGYLDHALGSPTATARVTGVTEWHINADEPAVLDYNTNFKSAGQVASLYAPDQYRMSDHDPVIIGLDYGPAGTKAAVIAALEELLPTGSAAADKRIAMAIASLEASLTPAWWIDSWTLHPAHGAKVFAEEHKAVLELTKKELAGNATVAGLIGLILDADRALAQTALDAAIAGGGHAQQIKRAQAEIARGDSDRAAGRYAPAVIRYKVAWEHAINALD